MRGYYFQEIETLEQAAALLNTFCSIEEGQPPYTYLGYDIETAFFNVYNPETDDWEDGMPLIEHLLPKWATES
jgi:hypothetical protein